MPQTQVSDIPLVFDPSTLGVKMWKWHVFFSDLVGWKLETLSVVTDLDLNCGVDQIYHKKELNYKPTKLPDIFYKTLRVFRSFFFT